MSLLQLLTTSGAFAALALAVSTYLKQRAPMKLAQAQVDGLLWAEISALRSELKCEREICDERIGKLEAKVADLEHDLASETMNFDSFLQMAEISPEKISEMLPRISEQRRQHKERVALKRGAREGAKQARKDGE